jgi:hypothetical protein
MAAPLVSDEAAVRQENARVLKRLEHMERLDLLDLNNDPSFQRRLVARPSASTVPMPAAIKKPLSAEGADSSYTVELFACRTVRPTMLLMLSEHHGDERCFNRAAARCRVHYLQMAYNPDIRT